MVYNLSHRKSATVYGSISLGIVILLTNKYMDTSKIIFAICDIIAIILSVFFMVPVIRNQKVEIVDDNIIVHQYGRKCILIALDLEAVKVATDGISSYRFLKDGKRYQVSPYIFTNGEAMQKEITHILDKVYVKR